MHQYWCEFGLSLVASFFLCLCTFLKPLLSLFCLRSALAIFLMCGFLWLWPGDPKIISQCNENPVLCCWVPYSAKMFVGFFLYILYEKKPQSMYLLGHVDPWLCPSNLSSCPWVSAAFPAWGNTYFYAQAHAWGILPGLDFGCLVLWGLVKRLLELEEGKDAHSSLEEPREGLDFVSLSLLNCLLVYAEKCLFPNVLCHQYVNLQCCSASEILHDDSGLVGWWFTQLNCQGIRLDNSSGLSCEEVVWFLSFYLQCFPVRRLCDSWAFIWEQCFPAHWSQSISWVACWMLGLV